MKYGPKRPKNPQAEHGANTGTSGATTGYEADLWRMADTLRGSMDAAEYKHVVLGLVFLKYISDAFEEIHARLEGEQDQGAGPQRRQVGATGAARFCSWTPASWAAWWTAPTVS